jgi:hypothetical protein
VSHLTLARITKVTIKSRHKCLTVSGEEEDHCSYDVGVIHRGILKSCGYALYIVHMIESMSGRTFGCNKKHHPLRIKNDLRAPVDQRRAAAAQVSPPRAASERG